MRETIPTGADALRKVARNRLLLLDDASMGAGSKDTPAAGDFTVNPDFKDWVLARAKKPAAVLIPVVEAESELRIVLTKRTEKLASHSGQISFPGGKIDQADKSPEAAALREAKEEINLDPGSVEVLGRMPDYLTGSGYRISPVIGFVDRQQYLRNALKPNPEEVDYIFDVPLSFLLDPANHRVGSRLFEGKTRYYLEMPYQGHYIWGVTAGIIRQFHECITGDEPLAIDMSAPIAKPMAAQGTGDGG